MDVLLLWHKEQHLCKGSGPGEGKGVPVMSLGSAELALKVDPPSVKGVGLWGKEPIRAE